MRRYDLRTNRLDAVMCKKHAEHLYTQTFGVYYITFQNKIQEKFVCVSLCTLRRIVCIGNDIPGGDANF